MSGAPSAAVTSDPLTTAIRTPRAFNHGAIPLARTSSRGASAADEAGIRNPSGDWRSGPGATVPAHASRGRHNGKCRMDTLDTDILILGAGGAGLFAALHAKKARPELDVTIAVKGLLGKCGCTRMVQGGYNVALAPTDSVERHFMDTDRGRRLAQPAGAGVAPGQRPRPFASANWRTRSAASSTAIPTAPCTRRRSPGRPSTAPCTRAISPASRSSTGCRSRSGGATCGGWRITARSI